MKWNVIFLLSLFGIAMGIASLFGFTAAYELYEWIVVATLSAYILSKQTTHKVFLHGVYSGVMMGISFSLVQVIFFATFLHHNPSAAEGFQKIFEDQSPQIYIVGLSPVIGGMYGLVIGSLSVAAGKFHIPK